MAEQLHRNVELIENTHYFIYVGEIKAFQLNEFLREPLARLLGKPVDFIAIVPDVMERYPAGNILVINPEAQRLSAETGEKVACRMPGRAFAEAVSESAEVRELVETLLERQETLEITLFSALPEMTLDRFPGVRLLTPDSALADYWNSKIHMYEDLGDRVPVPPYRIFNSRDALIEGTRALWSQWPDGLFVSLEYSAAGAFSFICGSEPELRDKLGDWEPPYLVTRFIPHDHDPTVLAVVANEQDVYIGGIADQQMVNINQFRGSVYPSVLPESVQAELADTTRRVGRAMGQTGYRGIFGCDYIVSPNGGLYFVEVNARKQGTTMEMCCNLENSLPSGAPNLLELEYHAVRFGRFPENLCELKGNPASIHWGTYNFKLAEDACTICRLPQPKPERQLFREVARGGTGASGHIVVEHIGSGYRVRQGSFLGRVIAVAKDREGVARGLRQGAKTLEQTLEKEGPHDC